MPLSAISFSSLMSTSPEPFVLRMTDISSKLAKTADSTPNSCFGFVVVDAAAHENI